MEGALFGMVAGVEVELVGDCVDEVVTLTAVDCASEGLILFEKADAEERSAAEIPAEPATRDQGPGESAGAAFAGKGGRAGAFLDLEPGSCIGVCFIPVGGGEDGPPHFTRGMVTEITVEQ